MRTRKRKCGGDEAQPSLATVNVALEAQAARNEAGPTPPVIKVGKAECEPGTILNIASCKARWIGDVLDWFSAHARMQIAIEQDPTRLCAGDLPRIVGNSAGIRRQFGGIPSFELDETLHDTLSHWRSFGVENLGHGVC